MTTARSWWLVMVSVVAACRASDPPDPPDPQRIDAAALPAVDAATDGVPDDALGVLGLRAAGHEHHPAAAEPLHLGGHLGDPAVAEDDPGCGDIVDEGPHAQPRG